MAPTRSSGVAVRWAWSDLEGASGSGEAQDGTRNDDKDFDDGGAGVGMWSPGGLGLFGVQGRFRRLLAGATNGVALGDRRIVRQMESRSSNDQRGFSSSFGRPWDGWPDSAESVC